MCPAIHINSRPSFQQSKQYVMKQKASRAAVLSKERAGFPTHGSDSSLNVCERCFPHLLLRGLQSLRYKITSIDEAQHADSSAGQVPTDRKVSRVTRRVIALEPQCTHPQADFGAHQRDFVELLPTYEFKSCFFWVMILPQVYLRKSCYLRGVFDHMIKS